MKAQAELERNIDFVEARLFSLSQFFQEGIKVSHSRCLNPSFFLAELK